jgi:DNA-binding IclR family transcriptional regulator
MPQSKDQYFSKTLAKGLKVLSLFNEQTPVRTQTEISKTLGINITSTYRLINTLVQLGYLQKDKKTKKLRLGLGALGLASTMARTFDINRLIKSLVDDVHDSHNITIDVALVMEDALTIVYRCEAEATLTYRLPSVSRAWHTTSLGKAYLAFLPQDVLVKKLDTLPLEARTPKSITTKKKLMEELKAVRESGYSLADEEFLPGLITIGAPLLNQETGMAIGAVSFDFSTIQYTVKNMTKDYADMVVKLSRDISEVMASL